jgi:ribonucleoside-diphosphate reductase alpha chain
VTLRRPRWPPAYADYFPGFIKKGVENELLDERLLQYDLKRLGAALKAERDLQFDYLGLQTLYDRYFLHVRKTRIELPQAFFMRVAMGLALNEIDREARAIEFYEVLSSFDFMSHAHAVQQRHPALAAVQLLPDHRAR